MVNYHSHSGKRKKDRIVPKKREGSPTWIFIREKSVVAEKDPLGEPKKGKKEKFCILNSTLLKEIFKQLICSMLRSFQTFWQAHPCYG